MDWVAGFYSRTGAWWGDAEARLTGRDHRRVALIRAHAGDRPGRVLELGSGYGTTAVAAALAGHEVTAIEISDRAGRTARLAAGVPPGALTVIRGDFYAVRPRGRFDVVCYWNGFGVGDDEDQRRLLRRIAREWLAPGGVALIDVFNPYVWAGWDGDREHRPARPDEGYPYELFEHTTFDRETSVATDTWWPAADPESAISQRLRCYSPADLRLLLEGTGLRLAALDVAASRPGEPDLAAALRDHPEYVAVLRAA
ncbi:class I SAM-dependent methyltransferase [Actinoplanes sp. URMC 104]|uniref:class I SAM-dependent methyltransferase n=1 Tax=Actinoplanes sp. URMC 104 TaxID=3423409 RepID=UPI003F1C7596